MRTKDGVKVKELQKKFSKNLKGKTFQWVGKTITVKKASFTLIPNTLLGLISIVTLNDEVVEITSPKSFIEKVCKR